MKLSIVTINLNNKDGLKRTIKSVISQNYKNFEWIVIDGGSKDGSLEILNDYSLHFDYFISEIDNGIYNAMNKGILHAHGEYLLFLNSGDILISINTLQKIIPFLYENDFIVGREISEKGEKKLRCVNKIYLNYFLILNSLPHQATFIKRELFFKYGFYNENFKIVSDWWFTIITLILGDANIRILNLPICYYDTKGLSSINYNQMIKEKLGLLENLKLPFISSMFLGIYKFKIFLNDKFQLLIKYIYRFLNNN